MRRTLWTVFAVTAITAFATMQQDEKPAQYVRQPAEGSQTAAIRNEYNPRRVVPGPFRAIVNPSIVAAKDADVAENELILGVVVDGESRAYPINQLTGPRREIINDKLGETVIAATW